MLLVMYFLSGEPLELVLRRVKAVREVLGCGREGDSLPQRSRQGQVGKQPSVEGGPLSLMRFLSSLGITLWSNFTCLKW